MIKMLASKQKKTRKKSGICIAGSQQVVLNIQNFDKFAAVKMGVVPGHGQRFMAGHLLNFQGAHICHEKGGI